MYEIFTETRKRRCLMRISMIYSLILIGGFQLLFASNSRGQSLEEIIVTIKLADKNLEHLLKDIELQTHLTFAYLPSEVRKYNNIGLQPGKQSVKTALDKALGGTELRYRYVENSIIIFPGRNVDIRKTPELTTGERKNEISMSSSSRASKNEVVNALSITTPLKIFERRLVRNISGRVVDSEGEPLIGVNIQVKDSSKGTATDFDGNFTLEDIDENTILVISYIGYQTQEVAVSGRSELIITLASDAQLLDEVVVVGYGTQKKETLTGSIVQRRGEELEKTPTLNLSNSLTGMFSGLKSINNTGAPGEDFSTLLIRGESTLGSNSPLIVIDGVPGRDGMNDIDPSDIESVSILKDASAAIYGARAANGVIIITTKRGQVGKPRINYNYNQGIVTPTRIPKYANSWDLAQFQNEQSLLENQPKIWSDTDINRFREGSDPLNYPNIDYNDLMIRKITPQSKHNLSIRGGTDNIRYFVAGNYSNQNSIFEYSDHFYRKLNARSNLDANLGEYLTVSLDLSFSENINKSPGKSYGSIAQATYNAYPYQHMFFPNGLPGDGVRGEGDNPAMMASESGSRDIRTLLYETKLSFDLKTPVAGLSLDGFVALDKNSMLTNHFKKPWTIYLRNKETDEYIPRTASTSPRIDLKEIFNYESNVIGNLKINYNKDFRAHSFNAFIGGEIANNSSNWFSAERRNFISSTLDQLFAGNPAEQFNDGSASSFGRMNVFGRISEVVFDKYMIDINLRYDGSSIFPRDSRWGFFPGGSIGWILSEESFFDSKNLEFIDFLKLRGSYGIMGNDQVDPFQFLRTYTYDSGANFGVNKNQFIGLSHNVEPNPNITWEVAQTLDLGFDLLLLKDKMSVSFDYFRSLRKNILTARNASIPEFTGLTLPDENIGKIQNKGFELEVGYRDYLDDFTYGVSTNLAYSKNKIIYIDEPQDILEWQKSEGMELGSVLNLEVLGIYRTQGEIDNSPHWPGTVINDLQYKDIDGDGVITNDDMVRQNKTNIPTYTYSANFSVGYKNLDFSMLWQGASDVWRRYWFPQGLFGNVLQEIYDNRPTEDNIHSKYPNITHDGSQVSALDSEFTMKDASYVRLKNIEIGYRFSFSEKVFINSARLYFNGFNLLTFDKLKWFDPEGSDSRGNFYPQNKIFNLGINITL